MLKGRGEGGGYFNKVSAARPVAMPLGRFNHVMCSEARPPHNQYGIASGTIANVLKSKPKSKLRPKQQNLNYARRPFPVLLRPSFSYASIRMRQD